MFRKSELPLVAYDEVKLKPEKVDLEAFKIAQSYKNNILKHVNNGEGIYLYSKYKGNGKTAWSYKFAKEYVKQISLRGIHDKSIYYVNISQLFEFMRQNMGNTEDTDLLRNVETRILGSDLVIFDDLGAEAPTDWVVGKLYNYINHRYNNKKAMVFTSNLDYSEVANRVGHRIMDRVSEVCRPVEIKGRSRRRQNVWWKKE